MLFGGKEVQQNIVRDAQEYAAEKGFFLIFGAMVGGCSKGVQYYDSDYDTRFLYLDINENRIFYPWEEKEENLKHRKYFDESVSPYEWIPLWEATSFFQFLKNPAFDGKRSFGLYNIIGWTLQSPYTWDPYGLSAKLMPLVNDIFRKEYYIPYHVEQLQKLWTDEELVTKDYIYALYEALCILYADKYKIFPPVYMKTLAASLLDTELLESVSELIKGAQAESERFCLEREPSNMHASHYHGKIGHQKKFDDIIMDAFERSQNIDKSNIPEDKIDMQLSKIYRIMDEAIFCEQKVLRAMD